MINVEKSVWEPQQELTWLGVSANLTEMELYIPDKRIVSTIESINNVITRLPYTTAR